MGGMLLSTACTPTPSWYGVPAQHKPILDNVPQAAAIPAFGEYVYADEVSAERYFVKDVRGLEGSGRWTGPEPEFRFFLKQTNKARRFHIELGINDRTFQQTGPVTLAVSVNGNPIGGPTFSTFGDHSWDKLVPPAYLLAGVENRVAVQVLNPWQSSDPQVRLGFVLRSVGFLPK
jgi:hypothetical protein